MKNEGKIMDRFQNKYRIQSHRMPQWDYSSDGIYFITMVTQNRECQLGSIRNGEILLSDFGKIVHDEWLVSFDIRHELLLDEYIIMPNHLHAIIVLDSGINRPNSHVETHGRASLQSQPSAFIRKPQSISSFIAGFKSAVNSKIDDYIDEHHLGIPKYNKNNHFFQPNYHDHIIRNNTEYQRIKNYIIQNPQKWVDDKFYLS